MACSAASNCCESCAADAAIAGEELLRSTRQLVDDAARAAAENGQCGLLGDVQDVTEYFFGSGDVPSSEELCARQGRAVENLYLALSQLEEQVNARAPEGRIVATLDAIETSATGLLEEAKLSSWATLARDYARRVGQGAGELVGGALSAATEGVLGVGRGLGLGWTLVLLAAVAIYLNPNLLRSRS
jgi:hypothetical protein